MIRDMRPVFPRSLKDFKKLQIFENAMFYYIEFHDNCLICLEYHNNPYVLSCGHTFCKECIENAELIEKYNKRCVQCLQFYGTLIRPCKFFFIENNYSIKSYILLKRLIYEDVKNAVTYFDNIFAVKYFVEAADYKEILMPENSEIHLKTGSQQIFYQSNDGRLIFQDPNIVRKLKETPEYIYGQIKKMRKFYRSEIVASELDHLDAQQEIILVELY